MWDVGIHGLRAVECHSLIANPSDFIGLVFRVFLRLFCRCRPRRYRALAPEPDPASGHHQLLLIRLRQNSRIACNQAHHQTDRE